MLERPISRNGNSNHKITPAFATQDSRMLVNVEEYPDICRHYSSRKELVADGLPKKYWAWRENNFYNYDNGIFMTPAAWYGVTPEPIAITIAASLVECSGKNVLVDIFAGVGGNSIQFALSKRWEIIIAIEKDPATMACAQRNAELYGVREDITWIIGDCFEYVPKAGFDRAKTVVFASPPWGGPTYSKAEIFDLDTMKPYSLREIHQLCGGMETALYLPRTSDLNQIAELVPDGREIDVVQHCLGGWCKAMVVYMPGTFDSR